MGKMRKVYFQFCYENLKGRNHAEDLSVDGSIILQWIFGKQGGKLRTVSVWLRIGTSDWLL
jgi:hypothetical protein